MHTELVCRERSSLIRTQHIHSSQTLDGSELLDDGLLASEKGRADGHSCRGDAWESNGNSNDEENQGVDEEVVVGGCGDIDATEEST